MLKGTGGFINPEKILAQIGLKEGMTVADFGCGHGYFTLPVGRIVGHGGKVIAVDVLAEALEAVRSRAQVEGVTNIQTQRGNLEVLGGSKIEEAGVDLVLLHNVIFQSQKKSEILREAKRALKSGGRFILIDWLPGQAGEQAFGPSGGWRILPEQAKELAIKEGFVFLQDLDAGEYHYGFIFTKS